MFLKKGAHFCITNLLGRFSNCCSKQPGSGLGIESFPIWKYLRHLQTARNGFSLVVQTSTLPVGAFVMLLLLLKLLSFHGKIGGNDCAVSVTGPSMLLSWSGTVVTSIKESSGSAHSICKHSIEKDNTNGGSLQLVTAELKEGFSIFYELI